MEAAGPAANVRAAELVGALSLATDLGTGQPLEHALRTAVLSARLGELAGASAEEVSDAYYVALLHASGCRFIRIQPTEPPGMCPTAVAFAHGPAAAWLDDAVRGAARFCRRADER